MSRYLLILDKDGQEQDVLFSDRDNAVRAFNYAKDDLKVFSAALFATNPARKLLRAFERE